MSTSRATNPYLSDTTEGAFDDALSGALAATSAMDDLVHTPTRATPPPPQVQISPAGANRHKVTAATVSDAVRGAVEQLGPVTVISCEKFSRGVGPWRRDWAEAILETPIPTQESAPAAPVELPEETAARALDLIEELTGSYALEGPPVGEEEERRAGPAETTPPETLEPPVGAARLTAALAAALPPDPAPVVDPQLPPPPLDHHDLMVDLDGVDIAAELGALGLEEELVAAVADLDPDDPVTALDLVVTDALARAGQLPESGGLVACGVGAAGAALLLNTAHRGGVIGYLQWGSDQGPATPRRVSAALLAGIRHR